MVKIIFAKLYDFLMHRSHQNIISIAPTTLLCDLFFIVFVLYLFGRQLRIKINQNTDGQKLLTEIS